MPKNKRHLKVVPENPIENEDLEALLSEDTDEEFGLPEFKDSKPVKLKDWKAEDFASIYTRFRPHLERHAKKFLNNPSQIDEVVQDAFLYLMVSLPELDSEIGVLKFMKWKVKNLCIDIYRAQGKAFVNSIDDIAEPQSEDIHQDERLEQADDAAVVKLALSKLNPRHREVLIAQIYEEKTIEEIAMQINLSENATRQLTFRARAAFKKALLGDVDTEGMSIAGILSVAAKKAAYEAKKTGVQAMALLLFLVISATAFFSNNSNPTTSTVAEAPEQSNNTTPNDSQADALTAVEDVISKKVKAAEESPVIDLYEEFPVDQALASAIVASNKNASMVVYRASKNSSIAYHLEAADGVSANFTYDASTEPIVRNLVFKLNIDGIEYTADAQNIQIQVKDGHVYLLAELADLMDANNIIYGNNALSRALIQLDFDPLDLAKDGKFNIYAKS